MKTGRHLLHQLGMRPPIFGIAYSTVNWLGVAKGFTFSGSGMARSLGKVIANGHAVTFFIYHERITFAGVSEFKIEFIEGSLDKIPWARETAHAYTDVYYRKCTGKDAENYKRVQDELQRKRHVMYHEYWPNICGDNTYENCISASWLIAHKMGFASSLAPKGFWIPSISNWATWAGSNSLFSSEWKHTHFPNTNTHLPDGYY